MKRKIYAMILCVLIIISMTGCQLAKENAGAAVAEDKLAGLLITAEPLDLFDFEGYLNDNLKGFQGGEITVDGDTEPYQGRLYAVLTTRTLTDEETGQTSEIEEYVFPVEGMAYFTAFVPQTEAESSGYFISMSDPAISDGHIAYDMGDEGNRITLTGTIYVSPKHTARTHYFNPVYQSADGSVYAVSGSGFTLDTNAQSEGSVFSQTLDATATVTQNGKTKTDSTSVTLSLSMMFPPEKIVILQMDDSSTLLSQTEYAPDAMPANISVAPKTAYLIVETHKRKDGGQINISREICDRAAENLETFFLRADGICVKQWTQLTWPK